MIDLELVGCYGFTVLDIVWVVMVVIRFVDCASDVHSLDVVCCVMLVAIAGWLMECLISVFCWLLRLIRELWV